MIRLAEAGPGVKVLVTSRAALRVQDEHLYPVGGLDYPELERDGRDAGAGELSDRFSAIGLFAQSARRVAPGFRLGPGNLPEVVRICRFVDGMPLAILLAASWVRVLTPAEIATQLETGLELLETDLRDVPDRHRSMRAVFDHSWRLLTVGEREVMEALSVFRGGFTRQAARAVAGTAFRELRSLVDMSLVQPISGGRYGLHELLRQYAAERLAELPDAHQAVHDRHCDYFTSALATWGEELKGPRQREALAEMDVDIANARAAWDWAAEHCHSAQLSRAALGLSVCYYRKARTSEAEAAFRLAAERLRAIGAQATGAIPGTLSALAAMLCLQAEFTAGLGQREAARELLGESLDVVRRPELAGQDTRLIESRSWRSLASVQRGTGRGDFRQSYARGIALTRSVGDPWQLAYSLGGLADCDNYDGELRAAREAAEEQLAICRALGDLRGIGDGTNFLGWVCVRMGEVERGLELTRESVPLLEEVGEPVRVCDAHLLVGASLAYAGRYAESCEALEETLAEVNELGVRDLQANVLGSLGWVEVNLGEYERARSHLDTGIRVAGEANYLFPAASCWGHLARIAMVEGKYVEAERLLRDAMAVWEKNACYEFVVLGQGWRAYLLHRSGDSVGARRSIVEALRWTATHESYHALVDTISSAAAVLLAEGDHVRAIEVYEMACTFPYIANSRWHEDVIGRLVAQAAGSLPAAVVSAAKERGRARDVQATLQELLAEWNDPS